MSVLLQAPYNQFLDDDGNPLTGGLVYSYAAGTDTPKDTYTDSSGLIPAANPVELDAAGRADIWLTGNYKITVTSADGSFTKTVDNIDAVDQGGDMTKAVYDPANIAQQLVGTTAVQTITNKTFPTINIGGGGVISTAVPKTSFTGAIAGTTIAGAGTYSTQTSHYSRLGSTVTVRIALAWSAHTGTGNMIVTGLPFAVDSFTSFACVANGITSPAGTSVVALASPGSANITLYSITTATNTLTALAIDTAGEIYITGSYFV